MATAPAQKTEWLIIINDHLDSAERRKSLLGKHGEARKSDPQDFWVFGGALLGEAVQAGSPPSVVGSCMLAYASSKEEIIERLKRDVLVNEKVWDWDSLSVRPFWRPSRQPL